MLGENLTDKEELPVGRGPVPATEKPAQEPPALPEEADEQAPDAAVDNTAPADAAAPAVQELMQLWQQGEHMAVAAKLMFTQANYVDFVDLLFTLGHEAGRELGTLLDELADSEHMQPPKTPPEYTSTLRRAVGGKEEAKTL